MGLMLLGVFLNDLDDVTECILIKSLDDTNSKASVQRGLEKLVGQGRIKFMKFKEEVKSSASGAE